MKPMTSGAVKYVKPSKDIFRHKWQSFGANFEEALIKEAMSSGKFDKGRIEKMNSVLPSTRKEKSKLSLSTSKMPNQAYWGENFKITRRVRQLRD